ncbi:MAG: hypothetical protein ACR5LF_11935 [Symbiopectobacterium sp.]
MVILDPETRLAQLMTWQVDWIWRVPSDQTKALSSMLNLAVKSGETMCVGFVAMSVHSDSPEGKPFRMCACAKR